jgi:endonuclease/exonuclease/phosphatase family metal-dependent hydrolase
MRKVVIIGIFLWASTGIISAEPLRIVSYNVENLFHPKHDSVMTDSLWVEKDDWAWTPQGEQRWSYTRYNRKVENIARVLTNIGEWDGVDIAGLQEVENAACLRKLCFTLRRGEYGFVHYESPDPRGIDVALLYKKSRVDTINSKPLPVEVLRTATGSPIEQSSSPAQGRESREEKLVTRDILYVCARVDKKDTLHLFVCHLPSQRGGAAESEWKREAVKKVLQGAVDSVYALHPEAKIIVMGDMNAPLGPPIKGGRKGELRGVSYREPVNGKETGTHKYHGRWSCLDRFYTSPALDSLSTVRIYDAEWVQEPDDKYPGLRPKRTFNGLRYQDGYSDHLPIVLTTSL